MIDYEKEAAKLGRLVQEKQAAYGDSFGKSEQIFKILYPDGVKPENYKDFLTLVRMVDKMFRIATKKDAFGENPFMDIQGYALLASAKAEKHDAHSLLEAAKADKILLGYQRDDGSDSRIPKTAPTMTLAEWDRKNPNLHTQPIYQSKKDEIYAKYNKEVEDIKASKGGAHAEGEAMAEARRWLDQQLDALDLVANKASPYTETDK